MARVRRFCTRRTRRENSPCNFPIVGISNHWIRLSPAPIQNRTGSFAQSFEKSFRLKNDSRMTWARRSPTGGQPLREITLGEWDRRRLPEAWKLYFRQEKRCHFRVWHDALIFANPEIFELKVEPNFITEMTLCDPVIEERIAEIKDKLWQGNAICRLDWLYGYSRPTRDSIRQKIFDKIAKSELREAISMEVDLGVFMECIQISLQRSKSILSHGYC